MRYFGFPLKKMRYFGFIVFGFKSLYLNKKREADPVQHVKRPKTNFIIMSFEIKKKKSNMMLIKSIINQVLLKLKKSNIMLIKSIINQVLLNPRFELGTKKNLRL